MFEHIIVILDGSATSKYALGASITIAKAVGSKITFLLTIDPELTAEGVGIAALAEMSYDSKETMLRDAIATVEAAGVQGATGQILIEDPVSGVVAAAHAEHADLIMLGLEPRIGILRPFIRSIAEGILRETTIPLFVMRRPARGYLTHRVIVPIVDDGLAMLAVNEAMDIAKEFGSTLLFCSLTGKEGVVAAQHVVDLAVQKANEAGVASEHLIIPCSGDISKEIVRNADIHGCDVIVMASHVRQGLPKLVEGSVTEAVVYSSDVPVIIVHQSATA